MHQQAEGHQALPAQEALHVPLLRMGADLHLTACLGVGRGCARLRHACTCAAEISHYRTVKTQRCCQMLRIYSQLAHIVGTWLCNTMHSELSSWQEHLSQHARQHIQ